MKALACLLVGLVACGTSGSTHDYFGKEVKPPHGLDRIRPGMTQAEAMAALPGFTKDHTELVLPSGHDEIELHVSGDPVQRIWAHVGQPTFDHVRDDLVKRWPAETSKDHWRGTQWIAEAKTYAASIDLDWAPKLDVKTFFAGGPASLPAALAKVKPGMSAKDIDGVVPLLVGTQRLLPDELTRVSFTNETKPMGMTGLSLTLNPEHREELLALWGPGEVSKSADDGRDLHIWNANGWRATLSLARKGETSLGQPTADLLEYVSTVNH